MRPLTIFDLDGTLALIQHRRHFVEGDLKDWKAFYAACDTDEPNEPVIATMERLRHEGADVWIFSGRRQWEVANVGLIVHLDVALPTIGHLELPLND